MNMQTVVASLACISWINNLSRLYILNKNYPATTHLLLKALDDEQKLKPSAETKHALLKNLGWARLMQGDYPTAEAKLLEAIDLQKRLSRNGKFVFNMPILLLVLMKMVG
jgi:hypothetical protein